MPIGYPLLEQRHPEQKEAASTYCHHAEMVPSSLNTLNTRPISSTPNDTGACPPASIAPPDNDRGNGIHLPGMRNGDARSEISNVWPQFVWYR